MGGFTAFRNHLFNLFPHVFKRRLGSRQAFCLVIVDMMQFLAGKVKFQVQEAFDGEGLARSMRVVVESYLHDEEDYYPTKGMVALLDTPKHVPTNKARTQQKRHVGGSTTSTTSSIIMDEALYNRCLTGVEGSPPPLGLGDLLKSRIHGETIWRSNNLKFQVYSLITEELLKIVPPIGVRFILDDGIQIDRVRYDKERASLITRFAFDARSAYEQECLVANLMRQEHTQRFMVSQKKGVTLLPQTGIGEADVKIPRFLAHGNNTRRYMIVSQDTDIIFILLLHLKRMLKNNQNDDFEVWLDTQTPTDRKMRASRQYRFIDVRALYDAIMQLFAREYPQVKNPIETLIFLVYALETDFTSAFDTCLHVTPKVVWNTFSALHTAPLVLKERGYILFNEQMYDEMVAAGTKREKNKEKETAKMGTKRSTEKVIPYPMEWHQLLSGAVTYEYDETTDFYSLKLDDMACQRFLYLLCQQRLVDDLGAVGVAQFDKKKGLHRTTITTSDEIFMWTSEIASRLEAYRVSSEVTKEEQESKKRKSMEALFHETDKRVRLSDSSSKSATTEQSEQKQPLRLPVKRALFPQPCTKTPQPSPSEFMDICRMIDEIEDPDDDPLSPFPKLKPIVVPALTSTSINKKLQELTQKQVPKDYGIPRLPSMLARIYRMEWLLNYHQNGWKTSTFMTNFADPHPNDGALSLYGWRAQEIAQSEEAVRRGDFNNSYYTCVYEEGVAATVKEPGFMPFRVYEMVETDQVYHRSHERYAQSFGV